MLLDAAAIVLKAIEKACVAFQAGKAAPWDYLPTSEGAAIDTLKEATVVEWKPMADTEEAINRVEDYANAAARAKS